MTIQRLEHYLTTKKGGGTGELTTCITTEGGLKHYDREAESRETASNDSLVHLSM